MLELGFIKKITGWLEILLFFIFAMLMLLDYAFIPGYFKKYGATMFNLSLLTTTFYSLVFEILLFSMEFSWLYILGFILIIVGLVIYNKPYKKENTDKLMNELY